MKTADDAIDRHWARIGAVAEFRRMAGLVLHRFPHAAEDLRLALDAAILERKTTGVSGMAIERPAKAKAKPKKPARRIMPEATKKHLGRIMRKRWRVVKLAGGSKLTKAAS